jgi:VanZ family protein
MPSALLDSRWLAVVAWATVIFVLSGTPSLNSGLGTWDLLLRKGAHFTEYAILGGLLVRVVDARVAVCVGAVYAASDELHQHFVPGRVGAPLDIAIDALGATTGVLLLRRLAR